ncbi:MAG: enoyl-CoA hydratase [Carbonactinosporaceae bacterium]
MTDRPKVTLEVRGGIRILTLDDPDRRNAMGPRLGAELAGRVAEIRADRDARALVVAATGAAFCAGADLPAVFGGPERPVHVLRDELRQVYDCFLGIIDLQIPTIAAVQGPAIGAGLNLALSCDLRFAGPRATLGATFARIGLHPGGGCTYFLVRELGQQRALRLLLEGGSLSAEQAAAAGVVLSVEDDPHAAAVSLAESITALDPELARDIKSSVAIAAKHGLGPSLEFEAWAQASTATKPQIRETVARFAAGRHR